MESCSILVECVDTEKLSLLYGKAVRILHNWMMDNKKKIGCIYYTSANDDVPTKWFDPNDDSPTQFDIVLFEFCPFGIPQMRESIVMKARDTLKTGGYIVIPHFSSIVDVIYNMEEGTSFQYAEYGRIKCEVPRGMSYKEKRRPWIMSETLFIVYQKQIKLRL